MSNLVRSAQAHYGKFFANVHQMGRYRTGSPDKFDEDAAGKADGIVNLMAASIVVVGLSSVGYSVWSLMGHGKKLPG